MQQQINLYQPAAASRDEPFSARMMFIIIIMTSVLMLAFYGLLFMQENNLQAEISALNVQLEQTAITVEKLEMTISSVTDAKKEQQQLKRLKHVFASKQHALNDLSTMVKGNNRGMSAYFSALARKNIKAIWFTQINIYSGGQQIVLDGQTSDEKFIPNFISSLKDEPAFKGINFKLFNVLRNENNDALHFILQTEIIQLK